MLGMRSGGGGGDVIFLLLLLVLVVVIVIITVAVTGMTLALALALALVFHMILGHKHLPCCGRLHCQKYCGDGITGGGIAIT